MKQLNLIRMNYHQNNSFYMVLLNRSNLILFTQKNMSIGNNSIRFRIRYKVFLRTAVYLKLHCKQYQSWPIRMECIEMDKDCVWETTNILKFSEDEPMDEIIEYEYFTALYDNYERNVNPICWQGTKQIMVRSFQRKIYKNKFTIIFDHCNQRQLPPRSLSINNVNSKLAIVNDIEQKCMLKTIRMRVRLIKYVADGNWLYVAQSDKPHNCFCENDYLQAQKMNRTLTVDKKTMIWSIDWIFSEEQWKNKGKSIQFSFYQSGTFNRMKSNWKLAFPNSQKKKIKQMIQELNQKKSSIINFGKKEIPMQILIKNQSTGEIIEKKSIGIQNLSKLIFIYQSQKDQKNVIEVNVVLSILGVYKMQKNRNKSKQWEIQIAIIKSDLQKFQYHFQIFMINQIDAQISYTKKFVYQQNNSSEIHICGQICSSQSKPKYLPVHIQNWCNSQRHFLYTRKQKKTQAQTNGRAKTTTRRLGYGFGGGDWGGELQNPNCNRIQNKQLLAQLQQYKKLIKNIFETIKTIENYKIKIKNLLSLQNDEMKKIKIKQYLYIIINIQNNFIQNKNKYQNIIRKYKENYQKKCNKFKKKMQVICDKLNNLRAHQMTIQEKNAFIFVLSIIILTKKWGNSRYNQSAQVEIYNVITNYFPNQIKQKENILTILYYLNDQTTQIKKYNQKAENNENCLKCSKQNMFQQFIHKNFNNVKNNLKLKIKQKKEIQNNELYKNLLICINKSFQKIQKYTKCKFDQVSECIFRTFINYALIYSIGRSVFGKTNFSVFREDCGQFGQFCREQGKFANYLSLSKLLQLQSEHLKKRNQIAEQLTKNEQKIKSLEQEILQMLCQQKNAQVVELISFQFQLTRIQQQFIQNLKKYRQLTEGAHFQDYKKRYFEEIQLIDKMVDDDEKRCERVRLLKDNDFVRMLERV